MLGDLFKRLFSRGSERRREPREDVSLGTVEINGRRFTVKNWSSTGFLAGPCDSGHREGDTVEIHFGVQVPNETIAFSCQAIVVRVDKQSKELAGVFTMMDRDARIMVAKHFQ